MAGRTGGPPPKQEISRKKARKARHYWVTFSDNTQELWTEEQADHEKRRWEHWQEQIAKKVDFSRDNPNPGGNVGHPGCISRQTRDALALIGHGGTELVAKLARGETVEVGGRQLFLNGKEIVDLLDKTWKHTLSPLMPVIQEDFLEAIEIALGEDDRVPLECIKPVMERAMAILKEKVGVDTAQVR